MVLDHFSERIYPHLPDVKNIAIFRYWKEIAVDYDKLKNVSDNGSYSGERIDL